MKIDLGKLSLHVPETHDLMPLEVVLAGGKYEAVGGTGTLLVVETSSIDLNGRLYAKKQAPHVQGELGGAFAFIERALQPTMDPTHRVTMAEVDQAMAALQEIHSAMSFYAHPGSYLNATPRTVRPVISDGGRIARDSLGERA